MKTGISCLFDSVCNHCENRGASVASGFSNMKIRSTISLLAMVSISVWGHGFRQPDQDAAATARGEAFAATANNPSAIYYNPAGITQLEGLQVRGGLYNVAFESEYNKAFTTDGDLNLLPQFFATYSPKDSRFSFGLGAYVPYGLSLEWPETTGFRSAGLSADLAYVTVNPVLAVKLADTISLGVGPTFNFGDLELKQGLSPFPGNDYFRFNGDGFAMGFNAGLMWQISEQFVFGAAYRSKTELDYEGESRTFAVVPATDISMSSAAELPTPQNIVVGLSWRPTPKWNVEANLDWTDWNQLNAVPIRQALPVPPLVLNWESSIYYELGITRSFENGWHVSAGYIYNENSMPDATYSPLVADLDRQFLSAGIGSTIGNLSFDVAYQFGFADSRNVTGSPVTLAGQTADGQYDFTSHAVSVSVGWKF